MALPACSAPWIKLPNTDVKLTVLLLAERTIESMVLNVETIKLVNPSIIFCIRSFSAPNQPSATSAVTPTIMGIILVVMVLNVANRKLCKVPIATKNGLNLDKIIVKPIEMVAAKPTINDCAKGSN